MAILIDPNFAYIDRIRPVGTQDGQAQSLDTLRLSKTMHHPSLIISADRHQSAPAGIELTIDLVVAHGLWLGTAPYHSGQIAISVGEC